MAHSVLARDCARSCASRLCLPYLLLCVAACAHAFSVTCSIGPVSSSELCLRLVASAGKKGEGDWRRRRELPRPALGVGVCSPTCHCSPLPAGGGGEEAGSLQNEEYEAKAAPYKQALLAQLSEERRATSTVVEIGIGGFSTAASYPADFCGRVIGIEPDIAKHPAAAAVSSTLGIKLEMETGVAENLPLFDGSVDAAVTACTLCTVQDPYKALQEVKRVLKPGGRLFFFEHVLSETDAQLAHRQILATPEEVRRWGCHFDRRTLEAIKESGFASLHGIDVDGSGKKKCYFELPDLDLMGPTVLGIAVKS